MGIEEHTYEFTVRVAIKGSSKEVAKKNLYDILFNPEYNMKDIEDWNIED